jgi:hypothetical protein
MMDVLVHVTTRNGIQPGGMLLMVTMMFDVAGRPPQFFY